MKKINNTSSSLRWSTCIGYGSGDYALNLFWQGINYYLLFFYTDIMGLPNSVAGLVFAIGGIWDALSDPVMGFIAERTKSRWGAYRPYLLFGSLPLAVSFALVFCIPESLGGMGLAAFAASMLILFKTCYTVVSIPYSTLGAQLTSSSQERISLSGVRMYFGFLGGVSVISLANLFSSTGYSNYLQLTALSCGLIGMIVLTVCFIKTDTEALPIQNEWVGSSLLQTCKALVVNKAFLLIMGSIICVTIAMTTINTTIFYIFLYGGAGIGGGHKAALTLASTPLLSIPLWAWTALRIGKRRSWVLCSGIAIAGLILLFFLPPDTSHTVRFLTYGLITLGTSAYAVLFWSMLPDTVEYGEYLTGVRNESSIFGVVSSGQKLALAGTAYAVGLMLDSVGYQAGTEQSAMVVSSLVALVAVIAAATISLSVVFILFYPVSAKSHRQATDELQTRHNRAATTHNTKNNL